VNGSHLSSSVSKVRPRYHSHNPDDDDNNPGLSSPGAGPVGDQPSCPSSWFSFVGTACAAPDDGGQNPNSNGSPSLTPYQQLGLTAGNMFTGFVVGLITQNPSAPTAFNPGILTGAYQATTSTQSIAPPIGGLPSYDEVQQKSRQYGPDWGLPSRQLGNPKPK
jgi:hypothetical protein